MPDLYVKNPLSTNLADYSGPIQVGSEYGNLLDGFFPDFYEQSSGVDFGKKAEISQEAIDSVDDSGFSLSANQLSMYGSAVGAVSSIVSGIYNSKIQKTQLKMQKRAAEFNQRQAERAAQSALMASQARIGQISEEYERRKSSQKVAMAANGIVLGVGSAAEVTASTDIQKERSIANEYMNGYREAWGIRMQGLNSTMGYIGAKASRSTAPWAGALGNAANAVVRYQQSKSIFEPKSSSLSADTEFKFGE